MPLKVKVPTCELQPNLTTRLHGEVDVSHHMAAPVEMHIVNGKTYLTNNVKHICLYLIHNHVVKPILHVN